MVEAGDISHKPEGCLTLRGLGNIDCGFDWAKCSYPPSSSSSLRSTTDNGELDARKHFLFPQGAHLSVREREGRSDLSGSICTFFVFGKVKFSEVAYLSQTWIFRTKADLLSRGDCVPIIYVLDV